MLSNDIRSLRRRFSDFQQDGVTMPANQVEKLVRILRSAELKACQLEQSTINPAAKLTEQHLLDGSVVIFPILPRDNTNAAHPFKVIDGGRDGEPNNGGDVA